MRIVTVLLILCIISTAAAAEAPVAAVLISEALPQDSGRGFRIGALFQIKPGWHVYWKHAGDIGQPTQVAFELPNGLEAGELRWPIPERFPQASGLNGYGYSDSVLLSAVLPAGTLTADAVLSAKLRWLACSRTLCIPGKADLRTPFFSEPDAASAHRIKFDDWEKRLPRLYDPAEGLVKAEILGGIPAGVDTGDLSISLSWSKAPQKVDWAPALPAGVKMSGLKIESSGTETLITCSLKLQPGKTVSAEEIESVISYTNETSAAGIRLPVRITTD